MRRKEAVSVDKPWERWMVDHTPRSWNVSYQRQGYRALDCFIHSYLFLAILSESYDFFIMCYYALLAVHQLQTAASPVSNN